MSTITALQNEVIRLEGQLNAARRPLHAAMIEAEPVKVGDLVKITHYYGRVEYGKVVSVRAYHGTILIGVAPKTKTGFHAKVRIYGKKVEKIDAIPNQEASCKQRP